MIDYFRRKADSPWVKNLILIIVLAFVFAAVQEVLMRSKDDVLISFSKLKNITINDFLRSRDNELKLITAERPNSLQEQEIELLNQNIAQRLIRNNIIDFLVDSYQLEASDEKIAQLLKSFPVFQNDRGVFSPDLFQSFLKNIGIREEEYIKFIKSQIFNNIITNSLSNDFFISNDVIENIISYLMRIRHIEIVQSDLLSYEGKKPSSTKEKLKEFYEKNIEYFREETKLNLGIIFFSKNSESAKFNQLINNLEEKINTGLTLEEIAKEYKLKITDLEVKKADLLSQLSSNFTKLTNSDLTNIDVADVFSMTEGEISYPVETEKGAILIEARQVRESYIPEFDSIKEYVLALWQEHYIKNQNLEFISNLRKEYTTNIEKARKIAADYKLNTTKNLSLNVNNINSYSNFSYKFLISLLDLEASNTSEIFIDGNKAYFAYIKSIDSSYKNTNKTKEEELKKTITKQLQDNIFNEIINFYIKKNDVKFLHDLKNI